MTNFFHGRQPKRGEKNRHRQRALNLRQRRYIELLRRIGVAIAIGGMVWFSLQSVMASRQTLTVLMTVTEIQRGTPISADMVIAKQIPSDEAFTHALHNFNEATGRIAQVDIRAGSILLRDMMRDRPITPQGFSLISVRLMSGTDDITVGDTLSVMTITPCPNQQGSGLLNPVQPNSEQPNSDLSQLDQDQERHENITDAQVCLLTDKAIAMNTAATQETEAQSSIISLAMPPDDAARVLMAQEGADLIAVIQ